jgi:hypothetical protein
MTVSYTGVAGVASWCGVTQTAVSKWIERFPGAIPQPDGKIGEGERRHPDLGWLPEREGAWILFAAGVRDGSVSGIPDDEEAEDGAQAEPADQAA